MADKNQMAILSQMNWPLLVFSVEHDLPYSWFRSQESRQMRL